MLIKVAVNGNRTPAEHPAVPVSAEAQAAEARAAVAAGAGAIHVHVCGPDGRESLAAQEVARTLEAIRKACPGVPVGISTADWIMPGEAERLASVEGWQTLPDFASVNFHEKGAVALAELLLAHGVGVEAGLADAQAAEILAASPVRDRCFRILLEPLEPGVEDARRNVAAIEAALDAAGLRQARLLHGLDATAWPLVREAARKGYDTRIGFEDVIWLPDGRVAPSNAALVAAARGMVEPRRLTLTVMAGAYAVCRLGQNDSIPSWVTGAFSSVTRTPGELSVVCEEDGVPARVKSERGWRVLVVQGPLDFNLTGVVSALAGPLASAEISIFTLSTYDTDYLLVRDRDLRRAVAVLRDAGHVVSEA